MIVSRTLRVSVLSRITILCVGSAIPLVAGAIAPCTAGAAGENIIPLVSAGVMTYCVSDYGWSDSWFQGNPSHYNQNLDYLSGDNAPNLKWNDMTGLSHGWLSPTLNGGTLNPTFVGSDWSVVVPVHYGLNSSVAQSVITHPDGLLMAITTTAHGVAVTQTFDISNVSDTAIAGLVFADYFNFHPNGSSGGSDCGATKFDGSEMSIVTRGRKQGCGGGHLGDGSLRGSASSPNGRLPYAWDVGLAYEPDSVWARVAANTPNYWIGRYPGDPTQWDDTAGALWWDLGNLGPGQSVQMTVTAGVPEPAAWQFLVPGLLLLALRALRGKLC